MNLERTRSNVDVIVHGQTLTDDHLDPMERDGTMLVLTLTVFRIDEHREGDSPIDQFEADQERPESSAQLLAETKLNFQRTLDREIPIVMGTDSGMPYTRLDDDGYDLYYMVDWRMEPMKAIQAAIMTAAKSLHSADTIGSSKRESTRTWCCCETTHLRIYPWSSTSNRTGSW